MTSKQYGVLIVRVVRNTGPVGGPYRAEEGYWDADRLRGKRDRFVVVRTITTGTREHCNAEVTR